MDNVAGVAEVAGVGEPVLAGFDGVGESVPARVDRVVTSMPERNGYSVGSGPGTVSCLERMGLFEQSLFVVMGTWTSCSPSHQSCLVSWRVFYLTSFPA